MNAQRTSIETYHAIKNNGHLSAKRLQVYEIIYENGPIIASKVSEIYRQLFPTTKHSETIRNRVTELVKMGVVQEVGTEQDPLTKREVMLFATTDNMPKKLETPKTLKQRTDDVLEQIKLYAASHEIKEGHPMHKGLVDIYRAVENLKKNKKNS